MKRLLPLLVLAVLVGVRAHAAGTLIPKNSTQKPIAIVSHEVNVVIDNGFARTEVVQVFHNPNDAAGEAVYTFPVPKSASLSEITIWSGDKVLNGEVVPAEQAKKAYQEERDSGNDAGLGECSCTKKKDDVEFGSYKFSIARVAPNVDTKIRFVYYQPLTIDTGVGRYIYPLQEGGTDEVAKSFWLRNAKVEQRFAVNVELKSAWPVDDVRVPGAEAAAKVTKIGDGHYKVALEQQTGDLNHDFVLYYRLAENLPGRVEMVAYKPSPSATGTFMMVVTPGIDLQPITRGADYVFVLDVSGSMEGKLATLAHGVAETMKQMKAGDRFRVVTFSSSADDITNGFVDANPQSVGEWSAKVAALTPQSGTNVYAGLELGTKGLNNDRATSVILVTDGVANEGIVDPKEFRKLLKQNDVRVFGFLMGNNANWPLMQTIADASGGFYSAVSNDDDIIGQILLAKSKITSEALHDATFKIGGVNVSDTTGMVFGKVYRGQQLVIFGHYAKGGHAAVTLNAKLTGADKTYTTRFDFPDTDTANPELERLWALAMTEDITAREYAGVMPETESENAIRDIGVKYQLVTDYTSMLVLGDGDFTKRGIDRNNKQRIEVEHAAQSKRANAGPVGFRADGSQPMFSGNSHSLGHGRGGAFDPFSAMLAMILAASAFAVCVRHS
jgi:Ca-activated chloride channel family protein